MVVAQLPLLPLPPLATKSCDLNTIILSHIIRRGPHNHHAVLFTIPMSGAAVCWICLEGGSDDTGKPLVRDCACRGDDAGFAHLSCIIKYAQKKSEQAIRPEEFVAPWETCPNCLQCYQNDLAMNVADACAPFVQRTYGYPGDDLIDKMRNMQALRIQIQTRKDMCNRSKRVDHIHKLLALVNQAKKEHNMEGWAHMAPTTDEFCQYCFISSNFETFSYVCLGNNVVLDMTEESKNMKIQYYIKARDIFKALGSTHHIKLMNDNIDRTRAFFTGDKEGKLKKDKNIYERTAECYGVNLDQAINAGIRYVMSLQTAKCSIEAERLATKLTATSRLLFGETHTRTVDCYEVFHQCKKRRVRVMSGKLRGQQFDTLRYENNGDTCIVTDIFSFQNLNKAEEEHTFSIKSASIHPWVGCPVMCHGLINSPHLNGKLGDVRTVAEDKSGELRFGFTLKIRV